MLMVTTLILITIVIIIRIMNLAILAIIFITLSSSSSTCARNGPNKPRNRLKMAPGKTQNGTNMAPLAQRSPQEGPRWLQDGGKTACTAIRRI